MSGPFHVIAPNLLPEDGASNEAITHLEARAKWSLPEDYIAFLRWSNGIEGTIGPNYVALTSAEEIAADPYPYTEFVPGLLFFGGDGGAALFGFDTRTTSGEVGIVHTDDLSLTSWVVLTPSFIDFWKLLAIDSWSSVWQSKYRTRLY